MKKAIALGMTVLTVIGSTTWAAPATKTFTDYVKVTKEHYLESSGNFKPKAREAFTVRLNIRGEKLSLLDSAMKDPAKRETLIMLAAVKTAATEKSDTITSDAADASVALVLRSAMLTKIDAKANQQDPLVISNLAIRKIQTKAQDILTQFQGNERAAYKKVLVEFDKLVSTERTGTYEEIFLKAIEKSQGVTREKAIEIAKKLKDCV